jgi:hypothetical protein
VRSHCESTDRCWRRLTWRTPPVAPAITDYLARAQALLQRGRAIVDVGIYHSPVEGVKGGWKDPALNAAGYSYGFPSDGLLALESAVVKDGKLWADGPGYKVGRVDGLGWLPRDD